MVIRALSPHPVPLPQGEGTARTAQWKAENSGLLSAEGMVHPLPKGEGRGEGKENIARRYGNVLDLSCGRCWQTSIWLRAIHDFMPPALPEVSDADGRGDGAFAPGAESAFNC